MESLKKWLEGKKRASNSSSIAELETSLEEHSGDDTGDLMQFKSLNYFRRIRNNFSESNNVIVSGESGVVYTGILSSGTMVAEKKMGSSKKGKDEYKNVVELGFVLSWDNRELVVFLGCCKENIVVYEYMEGGDLDRYLFAERKPLGWVERVKIALIVPKGLKVLGT